MAIPMGPTTATLMVSFAALGGCGFWWQCGHNTGASTQYNSEVGVEMEAQVKTILEGAQHPNAHDNVEKAGVHDAPVPLQQISESGSEQSEPEDVEPISEIEYPINSAQIEVDVQEEIVGQDNAAANAFVETPSSEVTITEIDASVEREALAIETLGTEVDNAATNTLDEKADAATHTLAGKPGGEATFSETGSFSMSQIVAKIKAGTDKDWSSIYNVFEAPFWVPALGFALVLDAVALVFVGICCRKLLKRSSNKDKDLCDAPFEVTGTSPTFREAKRPMLDEPIEDSEEEEEEEKQEHEEEKPPAITSLEKVEGQSGKTEVSAGFDYTQIPSPISNDPFRFQ